MFAMWLEKKIHDKNKTINQLIKYKKASSKCDVNIGKKGVTENLLKEIKTRLKRHKVVKIRILKSALAVTGLDRKKLAEIVADKVNARLIEVRGRTFILAYKEYKEKNNQTSSTPS